MVIFTSQLRFFQKKGRGRKDKPEREEKEGTPITREVLPSSNSISSAFLLALLCIVLQEREKLVTDAMRLFLFHEARKHPVTRSTLLSSVLHDYKESHRNLANEIIEECKLR